MYIVLLSDNLEYSRSGNLYDCFICWLFLLFNYFIFALFILWIYYSKNKIRGVAKSVGFATPRLLFICNLLWGEKVVGKVVVLFPALGDRVFAGFDVVAHGFAHRFIQRRLLGGQIVFAVQFPHFACQSGTHKFTCRVGAQIQMWTCHIQAGAVIASSPLFWVIAVWKWLQIL